MACTEKLNVYLANLAVWNIKLHNLHWNVTGHFFKSLHEYTETLYEGAFEAFDSVAEVLEMRGEMPLSTMKDYLAHATIQEVQPKAFAGRETVEMIQADMLALKALATEIRNEAAGNDDFEVQALFEGFIAEFSKQLWFIRAMQTKSECGCRSH